MPDCGRRCHTPMPMPWGPCACEVAPRCKFGKDQKLFRTPDDWLLRLISGRAGVCTNCKRLNRTVREAYPVSGGNSFAQFCERRDPPVYPRLPRVPSAVLVGVVVRVRFARRLYAPHLLLPRSVPSGSLLPHHSHTHHLPTPRPVHHRPGVQCAPSKRNRRPRRRRVLLGRRRRVDRTVVATRDNGGQRGEALAD